MNKNLQLQQEGNKFRRFFQYYPNMPRWQDEYWPRSKEIYIGGLPAKATSNEVSGPNGNLKIHKNSF